MATLEVLLVVLVLAAFLRSFHAEEQEPLSPWTAKLLAAAKDCDRVRVRSGGTCHRDEATEETLSTEGVAAAVETFLAGVRIDDAQSGLYCMCCGEPTIELYRGEHLVLSLGFHHGRSLRWLDGPWEGDALLTGESQEAVCRWLAARGVPEPFAELEEEQAGERTLVARHARYQEIVPADAWTRLTQMKSEEDVAPAFEQSIPDAAARSRLLLRLYGCHAGTWSHYSGIDHPIADMLAAVPSEVLAQILATHGDDDDLVGGLARLCFWDREIDDGLREAYLAAMPALAPLGLSHPRPENRRHTLYALQKLGGDIARPWLREMLDGALVPRPLPPLEAVEPGGLVVFRRGHDLLPLGSDRVAAAVVLARTGDAESLPAMRALAVQGDLSYEDRAALDQAIAQLGG